jgi:ABC-type nitrate/sulfonate/bicarbonate transport system substrate-binding protein
MLCPRGAERIPSKNKEAVKKLLRAHVDSMQFIKDHREEMIGIAVKYTG